MPNPIDSSLAPIEISSDGGVTYKVLICVSGWTLPIQTQSTSTDTQCGRIIGLGFFSFNPTVQAVCDYTASAVQVTYKDCLSWQVNKTLLKFRVQSPAVPSYALGAAYYITGQCYITDTSLADQVNDPVKFTVTLTGQGTPNITVGS